MMDRQLGHLIHLVNDLLDVARITRGKIALKKEPAELKSLVAMALETGAALIEASGHALTVELPPDPIVPTTFIMPMIPSAVEAWKLVKLCSRACGMKCVMTRPPVV